MMNMADAWLGGFHRNIVATSGPMAELWALRDGLSFAKRVGFKKIGSRNGCLGGSPTDQ